MGIWGKWGELELRMGKLLDSFLWGVGGVIYGLAGWYMDWLGGCLDGCGCGVADGEKHGGK